MLHLKWLKNESIEFSRTLCFTTICFEGFFLLQTHLLSFTRKLGSARMSGSTSLARQLAALRTPGSSSVASTATFAGPFLFPEAEQLTSLAALKENVAESLSLLYSEDPGMSR